MSPSGKRAIIALVSFMSGLFISQLIGNGYPILGTTAPGCPLKLRVVGNCSCIDLQSQLAKCRSRKFVTKFEASHVPMKKTFKTTNDSPRKFFLDCGANVASSVQLFRETYPNGHEYVIHSFELDERLAPYFAPYPDHVLHCPVAVSDNDGTMTAFSESAWAPDKGKNNNKDMQWGGGTLYVDEKEKKDTASGGIRKLSHRKTVPTVDLSQWIQRNFAIDDHIIFKLDVEGAEYTILKKMLQEDTFRWIDKFYGEFHPGQPTGWSKEQKSKLMEDLKKNKIKQESWAAETQTYGDMDKLHTSKVPAETPGTAGNVYTSCGPSNSSVPARVALVVQVGMNAKMAHRLIDTIQAHTSHIPLSLFVHGDFAELFPDMVLHWSINHTIGVREGHPYPPGHFDMVHPNWIRTNLIMSVLRLQELDIQPAYYLPVKVNDQMKDVAKKTDLRIVQPTVAFPPASGTLLTYDNYYRFRDVERVPKALRIISSALGKTGGILVLDSDHPDSYMNSVFLLDYLVENSGFQLVRIEDCIAGV
ncbi:PREDICTED: uncharacterized protein LOC109487863 [Branchiostoma belcheri]|uniref:Uncharacterized protein LOC109487863 n=1 Tax=Branchiostoma belcheri TaxID=7741 RepID=A0A6P5AWU3_BRABE|nr:PREDICTED: uncharacterized protein LOC109487863 [Branchiostoma belcheri]